MKSIISFLNKSIKYIFNVFANDKMPVWFMVLGILITGYGTYKITPWINAQFEVQKAQSQYIMDNLKNLSDSTSGLFSTISSINNQIINNNDKINKKDLDQLTVYMTSLQWKAYEYQALFRGEDQSKLILDYSNKLNELKDSVNNESGEKSVKVILDKSEEFAVVSKKLVAGNYPPPCGGVNYLNP